MVTWRWNIKLSLQNIFKLVRSHKYNMAMIIWITLPIQPAARQWSTGSTHDSALNYHCRLRPLSNSDRDIITIGSWLHPQIVFHCRILGWIDIESFTHYRINRIPIIFRIPLLWLDGSDLLLCNSEWIL